MIYYVKVSLFVYDVYLNSLNFYIKADYQKVEVRCSKSAVKDEHYKNIGDKLQYTDTGLHREYNCTFVCLFIEMTKRGHLGLHLYSYLA